MIGAVTAVVILWASLGPAAAPQSAPAPTGHWEGAFQAPGQEIPIQIDLGALPDGKWQGTISIPVQNVKGLPLAGVTVQGSEVSFAMKGPPGDPRFKGTVSKDGKSITGEFTQGPGTIPFTLAWKGEPKFEPLPKSTPITKELEGEWQGTLDVEVAQLRLALKLANAKGIGSGILVSIDQGGVEIPIDAIVQTGSKVTLIVRSVAGTFEGELKGGELAGTWTQGAPRPLVFKRGK